MFSSSSIKGAKLMKNSRLLPTSTFYASLREFVPWMWCYAWKIEVYYISFPLRQMWLVSTSTWRASRYVRFGRIFSWSSSEQFGSALIQMFVLYRTYFEYRKIIKIKNQGLCSYFKELSEIWIASWARIRKGWTFISP